MCQAGSHHVEKSIVGVPAPLGSVEPHAGLLRAPPDGQLLFKIMKAENFLRSVAEGYLHFNRVDRYVDFPGADRHDGEQLPMERARNAGMTFVKAPDFSLADYYNRSRSRTYACSFSLENTCELWERQANCSEIGKVCVVFDYSKLRATLNATLESGSAELTQGSVRCRQIFSVDYGVIEYVEWDTHRLERVANPIQYTYLKSKDGYQDEKEMRISLSAIGMGRFALDDGTEIDFPPSLHLGFDFKKANADGTIRATLAENDRVLKFLEAELGKVGIEFRPGTDPQR